MSGLTVLRVVEKVLGWTMVVVYTLLTVAAVAGAVSMWPGYSVAMVYGLAALVVIGDWMRR